MRGAALVLALAVAPPGATAASAACHDNMTSEGRVAAVEERGVRLDDGRVLRLAGLEGLPGAAPADLAAGTRLRWRALGGGDRYGRIVAIVARADAQVTLQEDILATGAAAIGAEIGDAACLAGFRAAEAQARAARRGLWSLPSATKNAESLGQFLAPSDHPSSGGPSGENAAPVGRFGIFEGKVLSVREQGATIYVNFGTRSAQALTVTVARERRRAFEAGGIALASLRGRKVRIRGWVEDRGGFRLEASAPEQIEIVD